MQREGLESSEVSGALVGWRTRRAALLDGVERAHAVAVSAALGDDVVEQVTHAYLVLLSSQFQGFCRDLHNEVAENFFRHVARHSQTAADVLHSRLLEGRKLDQGNPSSANLGSDFGRFGIRFWDRAFARYPRLPVARDRLDQLAAWRNAIAHNDFSGGRVVVTGRLNIDAVHILRAACDELTVALDGIATELLLA